RPGNRSVSVALQHGGELKVSEDTDANGSVLTFTVESGATSESFAIEGGTLEDLRAVLEQESAWHAADHYLYRESFLGIPQGRRSLLEGDKGAPRQLYLREADLRGMDLSGGANLSGTNLRGAKLSLLVDLRGADLSRTDLSGARLDWVSLSGATFHQTAVSLGFLSRNGDQLTDGMLSGIVFSGLTEDLSRPEVRDVLFNHRNNPDSGSILTVIDTRLEGDNKIRCMELA
ncbi:pentapeptide repeat-containing protein, partial [Paraburkholderia sp. RL17-373-BIF-A]|uniref:pentapeptide repeat-containing protein n=1 Tax=Paraburkholderia sp. RL17-373-BIF-A TaxID=3031629 RepID=UPI0038B976E2